MSDEGRTERWIIVWFPPDREMKQRVFKTEESARGFALNDDEVEGWNPVMVHRVTEVTERMVAL